MTEHFTCPIEEPVIIILLTVTCSAAALSTSEEASLSGRLHCVFDSQFVMHVSMINSRNMFPDPIWSHAVCIIWPLGRRPTLPSNAVAMAFVETIQTLQLICEAWWELRALKMQNRKNDSWRLSLYLFCLLSFPICLHSDCFLLCLTPLTSPNLQHFIYILHFHHFEAAEAWGQRLDKHETPLRSKVHHMQF